MTEAGHLAAADPVLRLSDIDRPALSSLLGHYGLRLEPVAAGFAIPGSYWGDEEAGLIGDAVYVRDDTPLHSVLHEACHVICMVPGKRASLHTDASDSDEEENATCYLQILLADHLPGVGRERMMQDMDTWGYSFRLGNTARWFHDDASDARRWLLAHKIIDANERVTLRARAG